MQDEKLEQNYEGTPLSQNANTAITGFVGGLFWGFIGLVCYYFHFTEISPVMVLEPWTVGTWKDTWLGVVTSLLILGLLGILAAFLYQLLLKNVQSIWVSLFYGALLFLFVFYILNPLFPDLNPLRELKRNTIITTFCLYLLFGTFVGYSISYDTYERKTMAAEKNEQKNVQ